MKKMKTLLVLISVLLSSLVYGQHKVGATVILKNKSMIKLTVLNMRYSTNDDNNVLILKDESGSYMQIPFRNIKQIIPTPNALMDYKVIMKSGNVKNGYDGRGYKWVCGPDIDDIFIMKRISDVEKIIIK